MDSLFSDDDVTNQLAFGPALVHVPEVNRRAPPMSRPQHAHPHLKMSDEGVILVTVG